MKIIDAHVHIFERLKGFGFLGEFRPLGAGRFSTDAGTSDQMFPAEFGDYGVLAEDFLKFMDKHGVAKAVVMQGPAFGFQNQYLAEVNKKYPDRLLGTAFIDPEAYMFDQILDNLINNLGFRAFKLEMSTIGGIMGCHADNTMCNKNMDKLFDAVEKVGGAIALDIGGPEEPSYQLGRTVELADSHPGLHLVMCHLLEPDRDDDARVKENLARIRRPNIWTDISSLPTILKEDPPYEMTRRYLAYAKDILGAQRMLWATDSPGALVKHDYDTQLRLLVTENETFTPEEREYVLAANAETVYPFN